MSSDPRERENHEGDVATEHKGKVEKVRRYKVLFHNDDYTTMEFVVLVLMKFFHKTETEATLRPGESATLMSPYGWTYTLTHLGISQYDQLNRQVTAATVEIVRDGKKLGVLIPEKRQHVDSFGRPTFEPSTEVGIRSGLREDLYIVYAGSVDGTEEAVYRFTINPLVWWVWFAGIVLVVGGVLTMWPGGDGGASPRRTQAGYEATLTGAGAA